MTELKNSVDPDKQADVLEGLRRAEVERRQKVVALEAEKRQQMAAALKLKHQGEEKQRAVLERLQRDEDERKAAEQEKRRGMLEQLQKGEQERKQQMVVDKSVLEERSRQAALKSVQQAGVGRQAQSTLQKTATANPEAKATTSTPAKMVPTAVASNMHNTQLSLQQRWTIDAEIHQQMAVNAGAASRSPSPEYHPSANAPKEQSNLANLRGKQEYNPTSPTSVQPQQPEALPREPSAAECAISTWTNSTRKSVHPSSEAAPSQRKSKFMTCLVCAIDWHVVQVPLIGSVNLHI